MRNATRRPDGPALSQEVLRALLDLNRLSRQAVARGTLAENAQALLQYLLTFCRASRGAILCMGHSQQTGKTLQPLALAQMQEEDAHALLASGLTSQEEVSEDWRWLLSSIPLFHTGAMLSLPSAWEEEQALVTHASLPCSASLILGWSTGKRQNPQQELAYRGALLAQIGDALSVTLMHLLLAAYLAPQNLWVAVPHTLSWPSEAGVEMRGEEICVPGSGSGKRVGQIVTDM